VCRSLARRRCGRARRVCAAKASRSRSSIPGSTTRTPTSAAPAPSPRSRRHRCQHTAGQSGAVRAERAQGEGRHRSRRRRLQRSAPAGSPALIPHPDPNPLDCNGHGSHVAGTAAGFGVDAHGATYAGPYDSAASSKRSRSDPESRPGRTSIPFASSAARFDRRRDEAIDWAVEKRHGRHQHVARRDFGTANTSDALAAQNAAKAGIIVVASAGKRRSGALHHGSPASGRGVISVAAVTRRAFPAAVMTLAGATALRRSMPTARRCPAALSRPSCCAPPRAAFRSAATKKNMSTRASRASWWSRGAAPARASIAPSSAAARCRRGGDDQQRRGLSAFRSDIPGVAIPFLGVVDFRRAQVDRFRHGGACKRHARQTPASGRPRTSVPAARASATVI